MLWATIAICWAAPAHAGSGSLRYHARVVHNNRSALSYVSGEVDLANGSFRETVDSSYDLGWRTVPGSAQATRPLLPNIWQAGGETAQRAGGALPRFNSPLLRHFIVGRVIAGVDRLEAGQAYLSGQLELLTVDVRRGSFEIVGEFRGAPLVVVGRRSLGSGRYLVQDLAVLGPSSELYQYFFDVMDYSTKALSAAVQLPSYDTADYVQFPSGGAHPVAIRPVKDWLVFQAQLPNGRPLNLVFDSGAEMMILDELVLKVDALLEPAGKLQIAGALGLGEMNLYEDFDFVVGGVRFSNLQVAGSQLTSLSMGAGMRIHGIVGSEMLQLCQLDLNLASGQMTLSPSGTPSAGIGAEVPLTFIGELPHIEAHVQGSDSALLLLDTGQRSPLSVNLDWLDAYELGDELMMNGFLGDISGGLMPRYIIENLDVSLAGQTYRQKVVDAGMDSTFSFNGRPVIGSIGFPLLAGHFGGMTFDYSRKLLILREPAEHRLFAGRPEAWETPEPGVPARGLSEEERADYEYAVALATHHSDDPRRPLLLEDRDPASDDPRAGYAWTGQAGNLSDPLSMVRTVEPGLDQGLGARFIGWTAEGDPRHHPVVLPDRKDYNEQARNDALELEVQESAALDNAIILPELPVEDEPASLPPLASEQLPLLLVVDVEAYLDAAAGFAQSAASWLEQWVFPADGEDTEPAPAKDTADRELGNSVKPDDYPFRRSAPRLDFR